MDKFGYIIDSDGNALFSSSTLFLAVMFFSLIAIFAKKKISNYSNKRSKLKKMAEDYERKREYRENLEYHYHWQLDSGEREAAKRTSIEILELDEDLAEMYKEYQQLKELGIVDVKYV